MAGPPDAEPGVRIGFREIYDLVVETRDAVRTLADRDQERAAQVEGLRRAVQEQDERTTALELGRARTLGVALGYSTAAFVAEGVIIWALNRH